MLIITLFSFLADIMSSFHTNSNWLFPFVAAGNYIEIILNTALLPVFFRYVCDQFFEVNVKLRRTMDLVLCVMAIICVIMVISTAFTGQIFYFDEAKVYHRGPLFTLPMVILFVMISIIEAFLISQKKKVDPLYYRSLVLFLVAPLIGCIIQFFIYGLPFSLLGITFAALILFTNIQNRNMDRDYLTGIYNRKRLDHYIQKKISASTEEKSFSAILIDIDNFKFINDQFGHVEGDKALINAANVLRDSFEFTDFVARYGGDEFCIILDSNDPKMIENAILNINKNLQKFNREKNELYQLEFSIGYGIYHRSIGDKTELFLKIIDQKMYEHKNEKKWTTMNRV